MSKLGIVFCLLVALSVVHGINLFNRKKERLDKSKATLDEKIQKTIDRIVGVSKKNKETSESISNAVKETKSQLDKELQEPFLHDQKKALGEIESIKEEYDGLDLTDCLITTDELLVSVNKSIADFNACTDMRMKETTDYVDTTNQKTDAIFKALTDSSEESGKCLGLFTRIMAYHRAAACLKKIDGRVTSLIDKQITDYEKDVSKIMDKLMTIKPSFENCKNMSKLEFTEMKTKLNCAINELRVCADKKLEVMEADYENNETIEEKESDSTLPPSENSTNNSSTA